MERDGGSLQNDYFNALRKDRALVAVYLANGKRLVGRIRSFDRYTLLLDGGHGEQMVFKHAVSTVSIVRNPAVLSPEGESTVGDHAAAFSAGTDGGRGPLTS